ncbi:MAG: hypothetical protein LJE67_08015 [Salaquimonas sp.]|nr:hypothetical protein [Salaquimonas sp.]
MASLPPPDSGPLQLVYISVRPELIVRSFASFIAHYRADRAVVLTADNRKREMEAVFSGLGCEVAVLTDSEVLPGHGDIPEHAERNCRLRAALFLRDEVEDFFLALDDDCILLRPLPADHFVANGHMVARYSHPSLSRWKAGSFDEPTSFDRQQWNTGELLAAAGLPERCYAAHQAQILEKARVNAIYAEFLPQIFGPVDEWALYFNVACAREPDKFIQQTATTLFWPESFDSWLPDWFDDDVHFENHYPWLYEPDGALAQAGIASDSDWRIKRGWVAARYAAHHAQRLLNELSNGVYPSIRLDPGGPAITSQTGQLFGFPGMILKVAVECDGRQPLAHSVLTGDRPVAGSLSPEQCVGPRHDLAIRLPEEVGEYTVVFKWQTAAKPAFLALPLFVLPYPRL